MDKREYLKIFQLEDTHAWYRELLKKTNFYLENYLKGSRPLILDAGCGTGGLLSRLRDRYQAVGVDIAEIATELCRRRGLKRILRSSVSVLPFKDNSFDALVSLDVLYHQQVPDDVEALKEFHRVLKKNGMLILNLPAYNFLKSNHDRFEHGARRYTAGLLKRKVERAGFVVEKLTYSNTFLFPLICVWRILALKNPGNTLDSDLRPLPSAINKLAGFVLSFENRLQRKIPLSFGLSIFCIARKS